MKTIIKKSETFKLYESLRKGGIDVNISSCFSYSYDEDNRYFGIFTSDTNVNLAKIWDIIKGRSFEIIVSRMAEGNFVFEIRRTQSYKEFIIESDWNKYFISLIN